MRNRSRTAAVVVAVLAAALVMTGCSEDKKLKVTGLDPTTGDFQGGTRVNIKGNRFTKDGSRTARVFFGGRPAEVMGFRGDKELVVKAPAGDIGQKVDVLIIFEPGGEITLKEAFTYVEQSRANVDDLDIKK
ncbi:MAG: IPT/TIG domain-containing protein [Kofleriaceae bacterium]|nr:IPT/TIG domain-containing protein [Kofleriaceae bacterium]